MKIETKYNIGNKVWFIYGRSVSKGTIKEVLVSLISDEYGNINTSIDYIVMTGYIEERVEENHLFTTKEELLKSL